MLAFLLLADPLIASLQTAPTGEASTCPLEITFLFDTNGEQEQQRLLIDPVSDKVTRLDENGEPIEDQRAEQPEQETQEDENDDGETVSLGALTYDQALEALSLDLDKAEAGDGTTVYRTRSLPKGTIELSGKDLSRNSAIVLTVTEDNVGPYITEYREELVKPVRMRLVAKVNEYSRRVSFDRLAGAIQPTSEAVTSAVKVMGNDMKFNVSMTYDYLPCPAEGPEPSL